MPVRTLKRSCEGKQRYDRKGADLAARSLRRRLFGSYNSYRCKHCGWWHVGHAPGRRKRVRR